MHDESGASSVEYGLLLSGIAAVIIATVRILGGSVLTLFQSVQGRF